MLSFRPTPLDHPDARRLLTELDRYYLEVYGGSDPEPLDARTFEPPHGCFLVGYRGEEAVTCGGWHRVGPEGDPMLQPGDAELKRIFVIAAERGNGHARALLAELERSAAAAGIARMVLVTGTPQTEAVMLYPAAGYTPIRPYGYYRDVPLTLAFAKALPPGHAVPGIDRRESSTAR